MCADVFRQSQGYTSADIEYNAPPHNLPGTEMVINLKLFYHKPSGLKKNSVKAAEGRFYLVTEILSQSPQQRESGGFSCYCVSLRVLWVLSKPSGQLLVDD